MLEYILFNDNVDFGKTLSWMPIELLDNTHRFCLDSIRSDTNNLFIISLSSNYYFLSLVLDTINMFLVPLQPNEAMVA